MPFTNPLSSQPSTFSIVELTGGRNKLQLRGRALPYRPVAFTGKMRAEFTWYPGNTCATVQMLGPEESTTTVRGWWKDRFIKTSTDIGTPVIGQTGTATYNEQTVGDVAGIVRIVDGFRRRGQLLEVKWDELTRHGILTTFTHTWHRREDIEWEMEFSWMSQGEPLQPVAFSTTLKVVDIANEILSAIDSVAEAVNKIKTAYATVTSVLNAINNAVATLQEAAQSLADMANTAIDAIVSTAETAKNMAAIMDTMKGAAEDLVDAVTSLPDRLQRAGREPGTVLHAEVLEVSARNRLLRKRARALRALAARRQQEIQANTTSQAPVATFVASGDLDLRDVSTRYYGTPDEWRNLMLYNRLNTSRLIAGDTVIVPPLNRTT